MRWLLILFAFVATSIHSLSQAAQGIGFNDLKEALTCIDQTLDAGDWKTLSQALCPPLQPNEPNRADWAQLKEARGKISLATIYANENFPLHDDTFLVRVPRDAAIGGSRIRFLRKDGKWYINAVYFVR